MTELLQLAKNGDEKALNNLIKLNMPLVYSLAGKISYGKNVEYEELVSAGNMGLLKAIRNFDLSRELAFSTYAVPVVAGEMKRFIRDNGPIKVSRSLKEIATKVNYAKFEYEKKEGSSPSISQLSKICCIDEETVALALAGVKMPMSLDDTLIDGETKAEEVWGREDKALDIDRLSLKEAINKLNQDDGNLIILRYFKGLTQKETAKVLNLSQVQVSRKEKQILIQLKELMTA